MHDSFNTGEGGYGQWLKRALQVKVTSPDNFTDDIIASDKFHELIEQQRRQPQYGAGHGQSSALSGVARQHYFCGTNNDQCNESVNQTTASLKSDLDLDLGHTQHSNWCLSQGNRQAIVRDIASVNCAIQQYQLPV